MGDFFLVDVGGVLFYINYDSIIKLSCTSEWVKGMLKYDGVNGKFVLPEANPKTFSQLIKILSKQQSTVTGDMEEVMNILIQAHMWDFSFAVTKCCEFFSQRIWDNYNFIFNNIARLDLQNDFDEHAFFQLKWNITREFSSRSYLEWEVPTWIRVLKSDSINLEEIVIFNAIQEWQVAKNISLFEVKRLVLLVRFPLMESNDFEKDVVSSGLLDQSQIDNLRKHYLDPTIDCGFNCTKREFVLGVRDGVEF